MDKDAYYFSHDSNAKDDPKCVLLIEQLGLEGYGIYWVLIETLRDQPSYRYPVALIPALARRYNTTAEKMKTVISSYGLFEVDDNDFFSLSLMYRMERLDIKREQARIAGIESGKKRRKKPSVEQTLNGRSTDGEPVNESKVNNSTVNESTEKETLAQAFENFVYMRKQIKRPMTERAKQLAVSTLNKLASSEEEKIAIINQSIMNGWQGLFALKGDNYGGTHNGFNRALAQGVGNGKSDGRFDEYAGDRLPPGI